VRLGAIQAAGAASPLRTVVAADDPAAVVASVHDGNPLGDEGPAPADLARAPADRVLLWSGTLADDPFGASHPPNWMGPGRAALDRFCAAAAPGLSAAGRTLCFHPHARHVLNDVPSCLTFLREHAGEPLEIALAPASLIEPSMLDVLEDHLERIFDHLGPRCRVVVLEDVAAGDRADDACRRVPLGHGRLPRDHVRRLLDAFVPDDADLVLRADDLEQQRAWLGR
jgi:hypothetical protein